MHPQPRGAKFWRADFPSPDLAIKGPKAGMARGIALAPKPLEEVIGIQCVKGFLTNVARRLKVQFQKESWMAERTIHLDGENVVARPSMVLSRPSPDADLEVVVPDDVCDGLGWNEGDVIMLTVVDGCIVCTRAENTESTVPAGS